MSNNTNTELLGAVLSARGGDVNALPDNLRTTYLRAIYEASGGNPDELPDNLETTLLKAIAELGGGTGGGGGDTGGSGSDLDALIDGSITELTSNVTSIRSRAFQTLASVKNANFPNATIIGERAFVDCSQLTSVNFPNATIIEKGGFYNCSQLVSVDFPNVTSIGDTAFYNCSQLVSVDFPNVTSIGTSAFYYCKSFQRLILRKSGSITTLSNTNAFTSTLIASGTGYIYVPRSLVDSYKSATNWSTYANQFRALEDYTVDGTITGELDESKI